MGEFSSCGARAADIARRVQSRITGSKAAELTLFLLQCPTWAAMQEDPDPLGLGKDPGYFNPLRCEIMAGRMLFLHIGEFYSDEEEEQVRLGAHNVRSTCLLRAASAPVAFDRRSRLPSLTVTHVYHASDGLRGTL